MLEAFAPPIKLDWEEVAEVASLLAELAPESAAS
jgi:hypothetical protein